MDARLPDADAFVHAASRRRRLRATRVNGKFADRTQFGLSVFETLSGACLLSRDSSAARSCPLVDLLTSRRAIGVVCADGVRSVRVDSLLMSFTFLRVRATLAHGCALQGERCASLSASSFSTAFGIALWGESRLARPCAWNGALGPDRRRRFRQPCLFRPVWCATSNPKIEPQAQLETHPRPRAGPEPRRTDDANSVDRTAVRELKSIAGREVFATSARHGRARPSHPRGSAARNIRDWRRRLGVDARHKAGHDARRLCKSNVDSHSARIFVSPDSRAASADGRLNRMCLTYSAEPCFEEISSATSGSKDTEYLERRCESAESSSTRSLRSFPSRSLGKFFPSAAQPEDAVPILGGD
jgi:hypothetical protein